MKPIWICTICGALGDDANICGCMPMGKIPRLRRCETMAHVESIRHGIARRLTRKIIESGRHQSRE